MVRPTEQRKKCILIVDDEPAVRRTVRAALESAGYECAESENGAAGLAWLEENHADLIIADYHMPIMSGMRLLERLNENQNGKAPPVIMLSGVLKLKDKQKAMELGAYAIVDKPCNFRELVHTVDEATQS
ncbi:MAG: response regulator [Nitrospirales bacterium]|nr:response regulator [Nitrospira sp.]MDR4501127.1 response regulator [Nitrospirales bacterium]